MGCAVHPTTHDLCNSGILNRLNDDRVGTTHMGAVTVLHNDYIYTYSRVQHGNRATRDTKQLPSETKTTHNRILLKT